MILNHSAIYFKFLAPTVGIDPTIHGWKPSELSFYRIAGKFEIVKVILPVNKSITLNREFTYPKPRLSNDFFQ